MSKPIDVTAELAAMQTITNGMNELDESARNRVMSWAWDRYVVTPGKQVSAMAEGLRAVSFIGSAGFRRWKDR